MVISAVNAKLFFVFLTLKLNGFDYLSILLNMLYDLVTLLQWMPYLARFAKQKTTAREASKLRLNFRNLLTRLAHCLKRLQLLQDVSKFDPFARLCVRLWCSPVFKFVLHMLDLLQFLILGFLVILYRVNDKTLGTLKRFTRVRVLDLEQLLRFSFHFRNLEHL